MYGKHLLQNVPLFIALGFSLLTVTSCQGEPATQGETPTIDLKDLEQKQGGWEYLFSGESLDDWLIQGLEITGPKLEDGTMVFRGFDYWAVITKKQYKNFILRLEMMFDPEKGEKANTGILLRTPQEKIYKEQDKCFEIQLVSDAGSAPSKTSSGAIFGALAPSTNPIKKPGEWNSIEIELNQPHLKVTINGEVVQDIDLTEVKGLPELRPVGSIAIQYLQKTGRVHYKDIRIKPI